MTSAFDRTLRLGYGFSIIVLIIVGFFSWKTVDRLLDSNQEVQHSHLVMQHLESLLSIMKDAETGQRGYLLTGKNEFLEPYNGAYTQAVLLAAELKKLTRDNVHQQQNIDRVSTVLIKRLNVLSSLILKKQKGQAIGNNDLDAGKLAMDELRKAVAVAEKEEQILLKNRTQTANSYARYTPPFILFSVLFALGVTLYSYNNTIKDIKEKDRLRDELRSKEQETAAFNEELSAANEELTSINDELVEAREDLAVANETLELRVASRTHALAESEEELQALNEELTAMNEELAATNEELITTNEDLAENREKLQHLVTELTEEEAKSAKLAAIVESSNDAIVGKTLDGIVTSWNRAAQTVFGYEDHEMIGQSILRLIPEDRFDEEPAIISRIKKGEKVEHFETKRVTKAGRLLDVSLTISPIKNKQGEIIGVSKTARDISEKKKDEERKNAFIGMASHELKTPLTSLSALLQVLNAKFKNDDDVFLTKALDKAFKQAKKMTSLINGFLNISRLESGKLEILKQPFDLTGLISEVIGEARLSVSDYEIVFVPKQSVLVDADRDKIESVISNLLSNAIKYSPKGKVINVDATVEHDRVIVNVKDEGIGIKPEDIERLFDRYYRVESEHTKLISGFGVGLYLCSEIMQCHGGDIWVESEKGVGSTFYFTMPVYV